jgi:hypothetical protein
MTGMTREEMVMRVLDRWLRDGEINILDRRLIQISRKKI